MSSYCNYAAQHCKDNCCDRQGNCPDASGYSCYYTYSTAELSTGLSGGAIAGIIIGGIFLVTAVVLLLVWCCKRNTDVKSPDDLQSSISKGVPIPP
jgi:hypothetical protein